MKEKILEVLDRIRPALEYHGGDIVLERYDSRSKSVYVQFSGMCSNCAISEITLRHLIEAELKKECPEIQHVIAVP